HREEIYERIRKEQEVGGDLAPSSEETDTAAHELAVES
ncbi:MAG: sRNA-binding carbon storage regulator CsrA, partial [Granulosicoccus sp.]